MKTISLPLPKLFAAALLATSLCTPIFAQAVPQKGIAVFNTQSNPQEQNFSNIHVVVTSTKPFEKTVEDLQAELGKTSTEDLMRLLSASKTFDEYAAEVEPLAGRSHLIEVGFLNWGKVMSRVPIKMKANCFIIGNPLTARKLLEAGGPEVGLYLPTKIYVFEDSQGVTKISYDRLSPVMAQYKNAKLSTVATAIDGVLLRLANAAAN
ncbi:MAG: DUF302 domain-containing protein [Nostoc sp. CmiVER01]|uniref:DUF302 domain-containing protein n=1 Tax=Nostoc sp. CmiVER01 TaxID=3075384 RepID=UPI002AD4BB83|nr:DUF302 domain-containing protein [Nostoc sp. CmiVER01]MDZ8126600.1 DUF302 domain-containing protein [Nostoc sp. CmiVER01]